MGVGAMIAGSVVSGIAGASSSSKAAEAQQDAAEASLEEQKRQYDLSREDLAPYRQSGQNALAAMNYEMGLGARPGITPDIVEVPAVAASGGGYAPQGAQPQNNNANLGFLQSALSDTPYGAMLAPQGGQGYGSAGSPAQYYVNGQAFGSQAEAQAYADGQTYDYQGFQETPGYQFQMDEGQKAIERAAAARGLRLSSGTLKEADRYSQGLASQEYGNYYNRLAGLAGVGQSATNTSVNLGQNYANQASNSLMASGNAQASGYQGQNSALQGTMNNLSTIAGMNQAGYFGNSGGNTANALSTPWAAGGFWG
jgi:hypothetical protein